MDYSSLLPLGLVEFFGQKLQTQDLAIVGLLIVLEGVLSIDNALVLGLLAKRLPKHQQAKALTYGLVGAFVFRFIAIGTATFLLQWTFVKFLGGAYLVYIAVRHLFFESQEEEKDKIVLDEHGHPVLVEEETGLELPESEQETEIRERVPVYMKPETRRRVGLAGFWPTVLVIELTDIAFAVDSILAAIALVGSPPPGTPPGAVHPKLWVVITGGLIGVILMRFAAAIFIRLLDKFPRFEVSAYLLVIVIGVKLLADWGVNSDWSFDKPDWAARNLGGWKQSFEEFEQTRRGWVEGYETWLEENWIFGLAPHHDEPHGEPDAEQPDDGLPHTPHLLDFHSLSRPEFIVFWTLMVVCFGIGFVPKRDGGGSHAG
jgi:YkoY family integral membrane protein